MSVNLNVNTLKSTLSKVERGVNFVDFEAEVIVIGGGGRAGLYEDSTTAGNGGGAGSFISASFLVPATSSLHIQVGEGASGSLDGSIFTFFPAGDSKITYGASGSVLEELFVAPGGGTGDSAPTLELSDVTGINGVSTDGGSGGGKRNFTAAQNKSGSISIPATIPDGTGLRPAEVYGYPRTGSASSVGIYDENQPLFPQFAGGGGVNGTGSVADSRNELESFGAGIESELTFLSGSISNQPLAQGGVILSQSTPVGSGAVNSGNGGRYIGGSGLVAIKYSGEQKIFTNPGQVFSIEDYTIHLWTSSVDITTTGKTFSGSDVDKPTPLIQADVLVSAGGGGRGPNAGGGGAGALVTSSLTLGRNITYEIVVGNAGAEGQNGESSYIYGFEDTSSAVYSSGSTPVTMSAEGGYASYEDFDGADFGGDSGQGYIYKNDIIVQTFPSYSGGNTFFQASPDIRTSGGGASVKENGGDGTLSGNGEGGTYVGGTILYPWYREINGELRGDSFVGGGGNGAGLGDSNIFDEPGWGADYDTNTAYAGAVVIQYPQYYDVEDIVVTGNVTSSIYNGYRTHLFGVGTSSFTLNFNPTSSV